MNETPTADGQRPINSRRILRELYIFTRILLAMTVSSLIVVYIAVPTARDSIRKFFGLQQATVIVGDDIVINGDVPGEDDPYDDEGDPCEKPLTFGCEFAQEPDIGYLLMPPFIGPWEESPMRLHWTIFVLTSRWQLVCPTNDP